jgi:acyl-CoA thioesterase FadM
MYPFVRLALVARAAKRRGALPVDGTGELRLTCMPWDLDMFAEMNNGRVLTLYDLGRIDHAHRIGLIGLLKPNRWGFAVGGASVRYRRRVRAFDRLTLRTHCVGRDDRWFYMHQAMERGGEAVSAGLMRVCCTDRDGIVSTDRVVAALGYPAWAPPLPGWVQAWVAADAERPWPPMIAPA